MKRRLLTLTIGLLLVLLAVIAPQFHTQATGLNLRAGSNVGLNVQLNQALANYDIRYDLSALEGYRSKLSREQEDGLRQAVAGAEVKLTQRIPGFKVEHSATLGFPEIVGVQSSSRTFLTPASREEHEQVLRRFVKENVVLYGLTIGQAEQLKKTADYADPTGSLSWVTLSQEINGKPLFNADLRAAFTKNGELAQTVSELLPGVDNNAVTTTPLVPAAEAVALAAKSIGVDISSSKLTLKPTSTPDAGSLIFERGPFAQDIKVELQYFPVKVGFPVLCWSMVLWQDIPAYYIFVDAERGRLLFRKNITNSQTQNATYGVYNNDSPGPLSPTTAAPGSGTQGAGITRSNFTLISELPSFDNSGWIPDGSNTTTGNNVDAGLDLIAPDGIDSRPTGSPFRVFDFSYNPPPLGSDAPTGSNYRFGAVTNLFFWANRYHDAVYPLGFTEAARNFQTDNFGRGGSGSDAFSAQAQDFFGTNNANFSTPPDGTPGRCQMYIFDGPAPDRDGDLDAEIFIHEFTHGLSNRLHGNGGGLNFAQGGGMGEGWSDFYARSLLSDSSENVNGLYAAGAYVTLNLFGLGTDNYYYGIRRFPYAVKTNLGPNGKPHNPLTLADIDASQIDTTDGAYPESPLDFSSNGASEPHNVGEVWCMALLEVRARMIARLGFGAGNQRLLQLVTAAMKLDSADPTILQGRNSIIAADNMSFGGEDVKDIWAGFATRGMGVSATVSAANSDPISVTEAFDTPCMVMCPANIAKSNDPDQCGAVVTFATSTMGTCGTVTCSPTSGSFFPVGTTTVTCTATAGSSCTFTITVQDTQSPTITCPPNKIQSTDPGLCSAVVTYNNATATDNCPGVGTPVCSPPSGATFPKGTTTVTCTVKDASNNMASCSFTVTVNDTEKPIIVCPADINVAAAASCPIATSAPVTFTVTASDNCPGVTFVCKNQNNQVVTSGQSFPVGTTTVTCTATDTSNNMSTCTFTIKVFSACLVDESNAGNVVLFNAQTGEYRFCCNGFLLASGRGVLTIRSCIGTIDELKGLRKVHIEFDTSANSGKGKGTAALFLDGSTNPKCKITDMSMAGNLCGC